MGPWPAIHRRDTFRVESQCVLRNVERCQRLVGGHHELPRELTIAHPRQLGPLDVAEDVIDLATQLHRVGGDARAVGGLWSVDGAHGDDIQPSGFANRFELTPLFDAAGSSDTRRADGGDRGDHRRRPGAMANQRTDGQSGGPRRPGTDGAELIDHLRAQGADATEHRSRAEHRQQHLAGGRSAGTTTGRSHRGAHHQQADDDGHHTEAHLAGTNPRHRCPTGERGEHRHLGQLARGEQRRQRGDHERGDGDDDEVEPHQIQRTAAQHRLADRHRGRHTCTHSHDGTQRSGDRALQGEKPPGESFVGAGRAELAESDQLAATTGRERRRDDDAEHPEDECHHDPADEQFTGVGGRAHRGQLHTDERTERRVGLAHHTRRERERIGGRRHVHHGGASGDAHLIDGVARREEQGLGVVGRGGDAHDAQVDLGAVELQRVTHPQLQHPRRASVPAPLRRRRRAGGPVATAPGRPATARVRRP